ncbi:MAG: DUF309 domain-containing protein [Nitrospirota bacterium]
MVDHTISRVAPPLDPPDLATLPWYGTDHTLPVSRFIPGLTGPREPYQTAVVHGPWTAEQWPTLQPYLRGVDLFNRWYFWEAHEAWESLWRAHPPRSEPARYIQGLIGAAASLLKLRMGQVRAARTLSTAACERLAVFHGIWMGLEVERFRADLTRCFAAVNSAAPPLGPEAPRLRLNTNSPC